MSNYVVRNVRPTTMTADNRFNTYMQNGMPKVDSAKTSIATFKSPQQIERERISAKKSAV